MLLLSSYYFLSCYSILQNVQADHEINKELHTFVAIRVQITCLPRKGTFWGNWLMLPLSIYCTPSCYNVLNKLLKRIMRYMVP